LLTVIARSIEKLLTMKNLASSDGSTRWLNVSHQANWSTTGAHHSTVSVVTAGTCWAGPSSITDVLVPEIHETKKAKMKGMVYSPSGKKLRVVAVLNYYHSTVLCGYTTEKY
jgi:mRNA-degrading endonuclease HigB of HigAB toxin-antitoxin module